MVNNRKIYIWGLVLYQYMTQNLENTINGFIEERKPQVVSFGEVHPNTPGIKTTIARFTDGFLEKLTSNGYNHLVIEQVMQGTDEELERFYETGQITAEETPRLFFGARSLNGGAEHVIRLLQECRRLGVKIHGAGPSLEQIKSVDNPDDKRWAVGIIYENAKNSIRDLVEKGERVVAYTGGFHNDLPQNEYGISFAPELSQSLGNNFLIVKLYVPEFAQKVGDIPNVGAYLIVSKGDEFVIVDDEKQSPQIIGVYSKTKTREVRPEETLAPVHVSTGKYTILKAGQDIPQGYLPCGNCPNDESEIESTVHFARERLGRTDFIISPIAKSPVDGRIISNYVAVYGIESPKAPSKK